MLEANIKLPISRSLFYNCVNATLRMNMIKSIQCIEYIDTSKKLVKLNENEGQFKTYLSQPALKSDNYEHELEVLSLLITDKAYDTKEEVKCFLEDGSVIVISSDTMVKGLTILNSLKYIEGVDLFMGIIEGVASEEERNNIYTSLSKCAGIKRVL